MPNTYTLDAKQLKELRAIELHVFNHVYSLTYAKDHATKDDAATQALAAAQHARTTWLNKRMLRQASSEGADWQAPE